MSGGDNDGSSDLGDMQLLVRAFQLSKMLGVAAELGLADRVGTEPRNIGDLANESGAHPATLYRLLRALAAFGIFTLHDDATVSHSQRSLLLRNESKPTLHHAAMYRTMPSNWTLWGKLAHTIRTGEPAFEATFGVPNFEYLKQHPEEAKLFNSFMQFSPDDRQSAVVDAYDFSAIATIVDVGGGNGGLVVALLQKYPHLRAVLLDQENAVSGADKVLGPLISRCTVEAGDFFVGAPAGHDAYILSQILHDWSDEQCLRILAVCRAAMRADSRLLVVERVLGLDADPIDYLSDIEMMLLFPGASERTLAEYAQLFSAAGFASPRLLRTRSPFSILETRPV